MGFDTEPYFLKTKDGKYVTVRKFDGRLQLCAVEDQTTFEVFIRRRYTDTGIKMALHFCHGNDIYLASVSENKLQLTKAANGEIPDNVCYWFLKKNLGGGEHYGLQSAANHKYLSISNQRRTSTFFLSEKFVLFTDQKIGHE